MNCRHGQARFRQCFQLHWSISVVASSHRRFGFGHCLWTMWNYFSVGYISMSLRIERSFSGTSRPRVHCSSDQQSLVSFRASQSVDKFRYRRASRLRCNGFSSTARLCWACILHRLAAAHYVPWCPIAQPRFRSVALERMPTSNTID